MLTIPMIGWVARLGPGRQALPGFSVKKYGPQQKTAPDRPDFGNGVKPDGRTKIVGDPHDANTPSSPAFERGWMQHLTARWGKAGAGGVRYYLLDNEPALWHDTHRDAHPQGETLDEIRRDTLAYGAMIKGVDPGALVLGPEEWGWNGFLYSGADEQYGAAHGWNGVFPDRAAHGGLDAMPWLLDQLHKENQRTGRRLLDVFTLHIYPQGGDNTDDISPKTQALRNRSTRALWDPAYTDESWIHDKIMLIPRMRRWVDTYYPGTKIGITEYNWGAEGSIGGATAQADIWGIFGREGLDLATRWTTPGMDTPTFAAMRLYRDYDGRGSAFGDVGVSARAPDPDTLSCFAAARSGDGALTVMAVHKAASGPAPVTLALSRFAAGRAAQAWQLTAAGRITRLPDVPLAGGRLTATLPPQSVTLFVIPAAKPARR
jgi:hypothetical protein